MRYALIALAGAVVGLLAVWLGFGFRMDVPGTGRVVTSGMAAYVPAAIVGAVAAIILDYSVRRWPWA